MLFIPVLFSLPSIDTQSQHSILLHLARDQYITSKNYKNKIPFETKNYRFKFTLFFKSKKFPFIPVLSVLLLTGLPKK